MLVTPGGRRIEFTDNAACYSFPVIPTVGQLVTRDPRRTGLLGGARGDERDGILHERRFRPMNKQRQQAKE